MTISGVGSSTNAYYASYLSRNRTQNEIDPAQMAGKLAAQLIQDKDSDGDGQLSLDELGDVGAIFSQADADGDGYISADELKTALENMKPPPKGPSEAERGLMAEQFISQLIQSQDSDGDGQLNFEEIGGSEDMFSSVDADGDGYVTAEELKTALAEMQPPPPPPGGAPTGSESSQSGDTEENSYASTTSLSDAIAAYLSQMLSGYGQDSENDLFGFLTEQGLLAGGRLNLTA